MTDYWSDRYRSGGTSGRGSRGRFATVKARLVNDRLAQHQIESVLDIGCGDGYVSNLLTAPGYLGVDASPAAVELARHANPGAEIQLLDTTPPPRHAHLSLDVIHHLVDDDHYAAHMALLFAAERLVLVWVADYRTTPTAAHSRHRRWADDVPAAWSLAERTPISGAPASFYTFER